MSSFEIVPRGPFSWERAVDFLAGWPATSRHWQGDQTVRLAFPLDRTFEPVGVALHWASGTLHGTVAGTEDVAAVREQVARIFSLDADATDYPAVAQREPRVGRLMAALPGLRPLLFTSPYECAAWAVISTRISRKQAAAVQDRLLAELGEPVALGGETLRCFPRPERLGGLQALRGLSEERVLRLRGVAEAAAAGLLDVDALRARGYEGAVAAVRRIPGIGDFWSRGIYLRACGPTDALSEDRVTAQALEALHGLDEPPTGDRLRAIMEPYRPFRMWVSVLLHVAANRGLIPGVDNAYAAPRRNGRGPRARATA